MVKDRHFPGLRLASIILLAAICLPIIIFPSAVFADWGPDVQLSNNSFNAVAASVAVSGNYVHTAWQDDQSGSYEIYYRRSADGGATWASITRLTSKPADSYGPHIAASGSYVHIVWYDSRDGSDEIYYKRSTDNGATWGADTRLSDLPDRSLNVNVTVSGSNIHVVWQDQRNGNREIYYKRSTDNGATWGADTRLTNRPGFSQEPDVAASGNNVYAAWEYVTAGGNYDIYFKCSTDNGDNWGADRQLTHDPNTSWYVSLAVSGNIIHVTWDDDRDGDREIYYKRSADGGTNWGQDTRLTNDPSEQHQVNITASGSNAFAIWTDDRTGTTDLIYYRQSTDSGITWGPEACLTATALYCEYPFAVLADNIVHAVWSDGRTGVTQAYYKRSPAIVNAPTITSFNPASGGRGTIVTIRGNHFLGTTAVSFGGIAAASFTVDSDTQITAIVGSGTTGRITVTAPSGTTTSATGFTFTNLANLISATPSHGSSVTGPAATPTQSPVILPAVSVKSASLSPAHVVPGTTITVTANVVNTSKVNGSNSIKVYVNGELENAQGVTVNSGESTPVTFNLSRNEPGTYTVYVDAVNAGSFTVDPYADTSIILYISGALVLFALILGVVYITRRRTF